MILYSALNFLHVVGAIGMFVALAFERLALGRMFDSTSAGPFAFWRNLAALPMRVGLPSTLLSLVTGLYLMVSAWPEAPWTWVALATLVVIAGTGAALSGTSRKNIEAATTREQLSADRGRLWFSLQARIGLLTGILFLMVTKPLTVGGSVAAVAISFLVFVIPMGVFKRTQRADGAEFKNVA